VITDKRRVAQEIEMFDILFRNAVDNECHSITDQDPLDLNRQLLMSLIGRIDRDINELEASLRSS
jgi:hypothetical protein